MRLIALIAIIIIIVVDVCVCVFSLGWITIYLQFRIIFVAAAMSHDLFDDELKMAILSFINADPCLFPISF